MKKTSSRKLLLFVLLMILICSIVMIIAYRSAGGNSPLGRIAGAVLTPLENLVSKISDGLSNFFGYFYRYNSLVIENQQLREELSEYRNMESAYYSAISENDELRSLSGLIEKHADFVCEPCSVVSIDGSGFQSSMTLGKGSVHGIEVGDTVVTMQNDIECFIGYVSEVGLNYCKVVTVLNLNSKIAAIITRTREVVVAEGNFELASKGLLKVSYLSNEADVRPGDLIETSGGGAYPPGIIIGRVNEFTLESHGISSYASIEPLVDISSLKNVFVVKEFDVSQ